MLRGWLQRGNGVPVLAGLALVAFVALLQLAAFAPLERIGLQVFDAYQRTAPRPYEDAPVRIVDIDEESIARIGQWPWPRTDLARLNRVLAEGGARVVAYDVVFSEPDRTSPEEIAARLARSPEGAALADRFAGLPENDAVFAESFAAIPVVNGFFLERDDIGRPIELKSGIALFGSLPDRSVPRFAGATQAMPALAGAAAGEGSLSLLPDPDGIVRKAPLLAIHDGQLVPALSLEAVRLYFDAGPIMVRASDGSGETASAPGSVAQVVVGGREIPVTASGELWSYFTAADAARRIPAWRLLEGDPAPEEVAEAVGGRIVFVGASASGLRDLVATPLARSLPGVEVHAQAAEQMLLGRYLERPDWARGLEFFLVVLLGGGLALALPRLGATAGAAVGGLAIVALFAGSWLAFDRAQYLLNPIAPALALVLVYVLQTLLGFWREERRRSYIHNAFDRYLSPEIVKQIASDPGKLELGGEERDMTVLMCDIRGFSRISEKRSPKEVIDFLIAFLTPMSDILLAHRATLDKFIGDAILAFWNAPLDDPEHHRNGARAALAMVAKLDELNRTMPGERGSAWPGDVKIGIGLNSGPCCVGNMGSAQRLSYSLIGDTVNMAARLEGLTKQYGVEIIVGSELAAHLDGFALIELDRVRVVGRDAPETIFALLGEGETPAHAALAEAHAAVLAAYRACRWDEAERLLGEAAGAYEGAGLSALAALMHGRVAALRADPPCAGWDGVFQATSK